MQHPHGIAALEEKCRRDIVATLEFERQALRWYVFDLLSNLLVLRQTKRTGEYGRQLA